MRSRACCSYSASNVASVREVEVEVYANGFFGPPTHTTTSRESTLTELVSFVVICFYVFFVSRAAQQQSGYQPPAPAQPPVPAPAPASSGYTPPSAAPAPAAMAPVQQYRSPAPPQQSYSPPPPAAPQGGYGYQPPAVGGRGGGTETTRAPAKVAGAVSDPAAMGEVQQREVRRGLERFFLFSPGAGGCVAKW